VRRNVRKRNWTSGKHCACFIAKLYFARRYFSSKRYYKEDIVEPEFVVTKDGTMDVPIKPGIGVQVNTKTLDEVTVKKKQFNI
jgi:L-alanine-DL-glutamate epimerase-like enolase superfamily enzyme